MGAVEITLVGFIFIMALLGASCLFTALRRRGRRDGVKSSARY